MIQSRNKYLQFMLVLLAARAIARGPCLSWGRLFCSMGWGKIRCSSVMVLYWCTCCVFSGIPPLGCSATGRWPAEQRWRTVAGWRDGRGVCR